jgi:hypothetical protein
VEERLSLAAPVAEGAALGAAALGGAALVAGPMEGDFRAPVVERPAAEAESARPQPLVQEVGAELRHLSVWRDSTASAS